jgi:DNA repair exonuclease SbcCD ATPase subunit
MALFGNALDTATREVKRLHEARVKLADREQKAREELERLRADLPNIALQDVLGESSPGVELAGNHFPATTPSYNRIVVLELEIRTCVDAKPALLQKLEAAMRAVNAAKADEIRKQATRLLKSLDEHRAKVSDLKFKLEQLENCRYGPEVRQIASDSGVPGLQFSISTTMRLEQELAELERKAVAIEQTAVNVGGGIDASSLEELLNAIDQADETTIAPTRSQAEAWYIEASARADAEWNGTGRLRGDPEPPWLELPGIEKYRTLSASLLWLKDGVIDVEHSAVRYSNRFEIPRELAAELGAEYPAVAAAD